jgi:hypothetical protein
MGRGFTVDEELSGMLDQMLGRTVDLVEMQMASGGGIPDVDAICDHVVALAVADPVKADYDRAAKLCYTAYRNRLPPSAYVQFRRDIGALKHQIMRDGDRHANPLEQFVLGCQRMGELRAVRS